MPRVAIVDFFHGEPPAEFVEFQKAFEARGCPVYHCGCEGV
jgi:hypothetical protein